MPGPPHRVRPRSWGLPGGCLPAGQPPGSRRAAARAGATPL